MKRYEGKRHAGVTDVSVEGAPLNPRLDLRKHSVTGYEWGYAGSGPAQLALALLVDHLGNDDEALAFYQDFKRAVVTSLPHGGWTLSSKQIEEILQALRSSSAASALDQSDHNQAEPGKMKLAQALAQITSLPWYFVQADNDKVMPTVRILGRRKNDPSKAICFGRIDTQRDARYACHAANALPEAVNALRLLLEGHNRTRSGLSQAQLAFCDSALAKAEVLQPE